MHVEYVRAHYTSLKSFKRSTLMCDGNGDNRWWLLRKSKGKKVTCIMIITASKHYNEEFMLNAAPGKQLWRSEEIGNTRANYQIALAAQRTFLKICGESVEGGAWIGRDSSFVTAWIERPGFNYDDLRLCFYKRHIVTSMLHFRQNAQCLSVHSYENYIGTQVWHHHASPVNQLLGWRFWGKCTTRFPAGLLDPGFGCFAWYPHTATKLSSNLLGTNFFYPFSYWLSNSSRTPWADNFNSELYLKYTLSNVSQTVLKLK